MTDVTLPIGSSNSGTNDWADVNGEDAAIVAVLNGGVTNGNLSGSAAITDANLASPNNSSYRTLLSAQNVIGIDKVAATYLLANGGSGAVASGGDVVGGFSLPLIYFDDADYTVGSKTQKLRVRAQVAANATAPAITFTVGLYPVTVAGAADALTVTLGTVVTSSTVAFASPSASAVTSGVNSDFTIPADGAYAFGVVTNGTIANNSAVLVSAHLQTRSV